MPNAHECATMLLETVPPLMRSLIANARSQRGNDDDDAPKGQLMGQLRMLETLRRSTPTLSELAALQRVTPSTMSRSIDVLVRRGWVSRDNDPNDRRQVILQLTNEGVAVHGAMVDQLRDSVTTAIEQLDEDDMTRLYDGLAVLQKLLPHGPDNRTVGDDTDEPLTNEG